MATKIRIPDTRPYHLYRVKFIQFRQQKERGMSHSNDFFPPTHACCRYSSPKALAPENTTGK